MEKIRALILSGQNNHDWRRSSPFVKALLEGTGDFTAEISYEPAVLLADAGALERYDLIFSDYNGADWGEPARENFLAAVRGGTGLVILHAANNAFVGWAEYEKAIGLQWGDSSQHTRYYEFPVTFINKSHPITEGLEDFRIKDELYCHLENRQNVGFEVLATAYSDPAYKGTGLDEPVAIVLKYGEGRVYQSILGHIWADQLVESSENITLANEHFKKLLIRGCKWAAGRLR